MIQIYLKRMTLLAAFSFLALPMLFSTTIVVSSTADSGAGSLRAAVADAAPGDTIRFNSRITRRRIVLSSEIVIDKALRIRGNGIGNTVISGNNANRIFNVTTASEVYIGILELRNGVTDGSGGAILNPVGVLRLDGIRISDSSAAGTGVGNGGGAVASSGRLLVTASRFVDNSATGAAGNGGAILSTGGGIAVTNTFFTNNTSSRAGGAIEISGPETNNLLSNVTMSENMTGGSPGNGGGVHITGPANMIVRGGLYTDNVAAREGGALWNGSGQMIVRGADISNNTASGPAADDGGGGIFNNGGTLKIFEGTSIVDNVADGASGSGGGIFNSTGGNLQITRAEIFRNTANRAGGGIEDISGSGTVFTIEDSGISDNEVFTSPGNGGGIHIGSDGSLRMSDGFVRGNRAGAEGGGIWNNNGTTTLINVRIRNNVALGNDADQGGGGLYNNAGGGKLVVTGGSIIRGNVASGTSGSGGGILNGPGGELEIRNATIRNNTANRAGGGIEDVSGAGTLVVLQNATITSNEVFNAPGNGGGIHVGGDGNISFRSGLVRSNTAGAEGGGIWIASGTLTVGQGVIFDDNEALGNDPDQGGGALYSRGNGTIVIKNNVSFTNNRASGTSGSGGAILNNEGATLLIDGATFSSNFANRAGGAIEDVSGDDGGFNGFRVINTDFFNNVVGTSPGNGGAIHITGRGDLLILNGSFIGNVAGSEGSGVWNSLGTTKIVGATFIDNEANGDGGDNGGGAIFNNGGTMNVTGIRANNNSANGSSGSGGALLTTGGNMTVIASTFTNNRANRAGGAVEQIDGLYSSTNNIYNNNTVGSAPGNGGAFHVTGRRGTVFFRGGSVTNNTAGNEGGGLWNQAGTTMIVNEVAIMNNSVTGTAEGDGGGGIFNNSGILELLNSTVAGNNVIAEQTVGGGIFNKAGGDFTITNSTISSNFTGGAGGGIANDGDIDITNSTIAFNSALAGGGFSQLSQTASLDITGTIIADNDATGDRWEDFDNFSRGTVNSGGFNLIGNDDLNSFDAVGSDIINGNAGLEVLANNGGVTMTHALICPSDAVDAGNSADVTADQTGRAPFGTRDIGAYESPVACARRAVPGGGSNLTANLLDDNVSLFPNPTGEGAVNVTVPAGIEGQVTMRILDGNGRTRQERVTSAVGVFRFPLEDLPNGTYTMQIINGEMVTTRRLIKMK